MNTNACQVVDNTISFIVFKPFNEKYYSYSINSTDNFHLIPRIDLTKFMQQYSNNRATSQVSEIANRFFSFIYIKETDSITTLDTEDLSESMEHILNEKLLEKSKEKENKSFFDSLLELHKKIKLE